MDTTTNACPRDGAAMTNFKRSGVPMLICPTCHATLLPSGGLDQIIARERQTAAQPDFQGFQGYRDGKHGQRGGWGGFFGGGHH